MYMYVRKLFIVQNKRNKIHLTNLEIFYFTLKICIFEP